MNGQWYLSAGVSKKSAQRLKTKVGDLLAPGNNDPWSDVRDALNGFLFGWSRYFSHGTRRAAFRGIDVVTSWRSSRTFRRASLELKPVLPCITRRGKVPA